MKIFTDLETSISDDVMQKRRAFWTKKQVKLIYPGLGLPDDKYWVSVEKIGLQRLPLLEVDASRRV